MSKRNNIAPLQRCNGIGDKESATREEKVQRTYLARKLSDSEDRGDKPKTPTPIKMTLRPKTHNGTYELVIPENGVRVRRTLKTKDEAEAIELAPAAYANHVREQVALVRPLLDKLFYIYLEAADKGLKRGAATYSSRKGNVGRMIKVLEYCGVNCTHEDITALGQKREGYPLCEWYIMDRRRNGDSEGAIASAMRQACSLFSKVMMRYYKKQGIDVSWFSDWVACDIEAPDIQPFTAVKAEEAAIVAKCSLLEFSHPEMYKAYLLAYGCGMRSSEIRRALYSDFREDYDDETYFVVKNPKAIHGGQKDAEQTRVCEREWYERIMTFGSGDNLIVNAPKKMTLRDFPLFLREECGMGAGVRSPVHRLRKWCGHRIFREYGNSMECAANALGHMSPDITRKIYTGRPSLSRRRMDSQSA